MKMYKKIIKTAWILTLFIVIGCNEDDPFGGNNPKSGYVALDSKNLIVENTGNLILPVNLNTSINPNGVKVTYVIEPLNGVLPGGFADNSNGTITIEKGEVINEIRLTIPESIDEYSFRVTLAAVDDPDFRIGISDNSKATSTDVFVSLTNTIQVAIDENPNQDQLLTQVASNFIEGTTFSLSSESVPGALTVNETTGALSVLDRLAFDWEINPFITAAVEITFGDFIIEKQIEINLNDVTNLWTGPATTFIYDGGGDSSIAENQDRITENVWFARAENFPIYNAAIEDRFIFGATYPESISPTGTRWAVGSVSDGIENLTFDRFAITMGSAFGYINNNGNAPLVVHLVKDDVYLDLTWIDWHRGNGADGQLGGFSYERSTP